jgi:hypothetical protein
MEILIAIELMMTEVMMALMAPQYNTLKFSMVRRKCPCGHGNRSVLESSIRRRRTGQ